MSTLRAVQLAITETITIAAPREEVFAFITQPDAPAKTFRGHGPIPGCVRSEVEGGGALKLGGFRLVHNSDGTVVREEIVRLEAPERQSYALRSGFKPPMSWLVRGAGGDWKLEALAEQTRITWTFTFDVRGALAWPFAKLVSGSFRKAMAKALQETKVSLSLRERGEGRGEGSK